MEISKIISSSGESNGQELEDAGFTFYLVSDLSKEMCIRDRYSTQLGADVLGNLTRLSNLANGIEPSIEKTRNMQIQLEPVSYTHLAQHRGYQHHREPKGQ